MATPHPTPKHHRYQDITGHRFGRLTVVSYESTNGTGARWHCLCECGNRSVVQGTALRNGTIKSCGCYNRDRFKTHGKTGTPEHRIWHAMKSRCSNPKVRMYPRYGGRGIKVCDRWQRFENFLEDMGEKPSAQHQLDRIDNDGHYEPANCRWATRSTQCRNRGNNRLVTFAGQTLTVADWADRTGLSYECVFQRLAAGWSVEAALTTPNARSLSRQRRLSR